MFYLTLIMSLASAGLFCKIIYDLSQPSGAKLFDVLILICWLFITGSAAEYQL